MVNEEMINIDDINLITAFSASEKLNTEKVWSLFEEIININ